jgi:hypothetical protein
MDLEALIVTESDNQEDFLVCILIVDAFVTG